MNFLQQDKHLVSILSLKILVRKKLKNPFFCLFSYTVRDVSKLRHKVIDSQRGMLGMCYILEKDLSLPSNDVIR